MNNDNSSNTSSSSSADAFDPISAEDLAVVVSFNFLPHKAGIKAEMLLKEAEFLLETCNSKPDDWSERGNRFTECVAKVVDSIDRFLQCPNRRVAFEIYPMLSETRSIMDLLMKHFNWLLGRDCPLSEEKRACFYTKFGINGQFNTLLSNILEPNSWAGGVMVMPFVDKFLTPSVAFLSNFVHQLVHTHQDQNFLYNLVNSAMQVSPSLCYVMINSRDDILALCVGFEKSADLVALLKGETDTAVSRESEEQTKMSVDIDGDVCVDGEEILPDEAVAGYCNYLTEKCLTSDDGSLVECSVMLMYVAPRIVCKMLENFVSTLDTALKRSAGIFCSRIIFHNISQSVLRHEQIETLLTPLGYEKQSEALSDDHWSGSEVTVFNSSLPADQPMQ